MRQCETLLNDDDCEERCNTRCFSCGKPSCRGCSKVAPKYGKRRNKRICADCIEDRADEIESGRIVLPVPSPEGGSK